MAFFPELKKKLGFGCMRLPMVNGEVDLEECNKMVDAFLAEGFNYFDTAHGYIDGKSEIAIRECLSKRHKREEFILTDKLSDNFFNSTEDIEPMVRTELEACGVEYFDFLLMHAQGHWNYDKYKKFHAYEEAVRLKEMGLVRHVGISFHDSPEMLDMILNENPMVEVVQLQFNYLDYEDAGVRSRQCYEVCVKHNLPVLVMEPVRGGRLALLPKAAASVYEELGDLSPASYAIRFAAGFENIVMVLSGMSNMQQMMDNLSYMKDFVPLSAREQEAVWKVNDILHNQNVIPCTACRYCVAGCPKQIPIPDIFAIMNRKELEPGCDGVAEYKAAVFGCGMASACLACGKCEQACPQHIEIREKLKKAAELFE